MGQKQANETYIDEAPCSAWMSWAEGHVSAA